MSVGKSTVVTVNDITFSVEFSVWAGVAGTSINPPEGIDVEIDRISFSGVNVQKILDGDLYKAILLKLYDLEEQA